MTGTDLCVNKPHKSRSYLNHLVHWFHYIRQTELHTAELVVPKPSASEFESAIENLKSHKLPGIDQIPAELIKAGSRTIRSEIHKLIISIWNKEKFPEEWKESITEPIYMKDDETDCSTYRGISLLSTTYQPSIQHFAV